MKSLIKKILPKSIIGLYHILKAYCATLIYGFPSRKMTVIGITGTKGKSTTVYLLGKILQESGKKTGWSSSISFCDGTKQIPNPFHMTMPSPFILQKVLRQMLNKGVKFAVLEVTSEGIKQHRHLGIKFNSAVLTNLQPEHIEAHGGFENYKKAKLKLFEAVVKNQNYRYPKLGNNKKFIVVNGDDQNAKDFLNFDNVQKWVFQYDLEKSEVPPQNQLQNKVFYKINKIDVNGSIFDLEFNDQKTTIQLNLVGRFNVINAAAAATCALALGVKLETIKKALEKVTALEGRMEFIDKGQDFSLIIDLAHTPDSFRAVFETIKNFKKPHSKIITLFGCAGGGRDKWKRPVMGNIAAQNSNIVIITNEDPYDDNPQQIIDDIKSGIEDYKLKIKKSELFEIPNREEAIKKAISLAQKDDIVLLLGKGTEATMVFEKGKTIKWNEKKIVKKYLRVGK